MSRNFDLKARAFKFAATAVALFSAAILFAVPARAQQRVLTSADYARAEKFMGYNTTPLVTGVIGVGGGHRGGRGVNWLPDERFTYALTTSDGTEYILVDPAKGTRAISITQKLLSRFLPRQIQRMTRIIFPSPNLIIPPTVTP